MIGQISSYSCLGGAGYKGRTSGNFMPSPYLDYTSTQMWKSFADLLDWSEFIYINSGEIKELHKRLYNYFNTDIEVRALSAAEKPLDTLDAKEWKTLLTEDLNWQTHASMLLENVGAYGNDFISVLAPTERYLQCPRCGGRGPLRQLAVLAGADFGFKDFKFLMRCPFSGCRKDKVKDLQSFKEDAVPINLADKFIIKHWPVREMVLHYYEWSDSADIYWNIPESYKRAVTSGDINTLAEADSNVLEAIKQNKLFKFNRDRIFHAKEHTLSGLQLRGWGLPRTISMHKQVWTLHMLRKQVQALAMDYVMPIRLVSPTSQATPTPMGAMSPFSVVNHGDFQQMFSGVLSEHRSDPTRWHSMPFPLEYSLLGGEASQLFPVEMLTTTKEDLIDAGGIPVELYKSNLSLQVAPVGLRLFEAQNRAIPSLLNQAVRFVVSRVTELSAKEPVRVSHTKVQIIDNVDTLMAQLQLAASGQMSLSGPLERMGVDFEDDIHRQFNENRLRTDAQERMQEEQMRRQESMGAMQQAMAGAPPAGAPAPGGAPAGDPMAGMLPSTGFVPPQSIDQMESAAMSLAQQLSMMDPMSRENELKVMREQYPTFHAVVMQRLDEVRRQQGQEGRQMMLNGGM